MFLAIKVLPSPFVPHRMKIAAGGEEVQGEGAFDQGAVNLLGPVPIEIGQRFEAAEAGLGEAAFEAAASPVFGFGAGDFFQQLAGTPALSRGAGQEIVQTLCGDQQAEMIQLRGQIRIRARVLPRGLGEFIVSLQRGI